MATHSEISAYREKLLEHLFIGELLRHQGNAFGEKTPRPNIRVLRRADFTPVAGVPELVERLFGQIAPITAV